MPVRVPLITDPAARVLLDGIVDYAGLFPPAALNMREAVRNYARYRGGEAGWMLGRLVCPVPALDDFAREAEPLLPRDPGAIPWRLAAIGTGDHTADANAIAVVNQNHRYSWEECSAIVDTIEVRAAAPADVQAIDGAFPSDAHVYVEVPLQPDVEPFIEALSRTGRRAKIRTGGVTADAFPSAQQVVSFVESCVRHHVPFKATAGLHHPLTGSYALTYEPGAAQAQMFGFLNLFLVAALTVKGHDRAWRERALLETDPSALSFADAGITWQGFVLDRNELAHLREHVAVSFGACSFSEPVDEVRALGAW